MRALGRDLSVLLADPPIGPLICEGKGCYRLHPRKRVFGRKRVTLWLCGWCWEAAHRGDPAESRLRKGASSC